MATEQCAVSRCERGGSARAATGGTLARSRARQRASRKSTSCARPRIAHRPRASRAARGRARLRGQQRLAQARLVQRGEQRRADPTPKRALRQRLPRLRAQLRQQRRHARRRLARAHRARRPGSPVAAPAALAARGGAAEHRARRAVPERALGNAAHAQAHGRRRRGRRSAVRHATALGHDVRLARRVRPQRLRLGRRQLPAQVMQQRPQHVCIRVVIRPRRSRCVCSGALPRARVSR